MVRRIENFLLRGEIDARHPGRITGRLWLTNHAQPIQLDLCGHAAPDLDGHVLLFENPSPAPAASPELPQLSPTQRGPVTACTASLKLRPVGEPSAAAPRPAPWSNALQIAWHDENDGPVLIESAAFLVRLDNEDATTSANVATNLDAEADADAPTSTAEALADAERARQELLLDRVQARIERAESVGEEPDFERILDEERSRLCRERGEPDVDEPESDDETAARAAWIEELNAAAEDALAELDAEDHPATLPEHPLVHQVHELGHRVHLDLCAHGWAAESDSDEHPLLMLDQGLMFAAAKLAGALNPRAEPAEWPPEPLFAGDVLVRLKKARAHLRDALAGLDAAQENHLADPAWLHQLHPEIMRLRMDVDHFISEVRAVLESAEGAPDND